MKKVILTLFLVASLPGLAGATSVEDCSIASGSFATLGGVFQSNFETVTGHSPTSTAGSVQCFIKSFYAGTIYAFGKLSAALIGWWYVWSIMAFAFAALGFFLL